MCRRCDIHVYNTTSDTYSKLSCNTYICPECGKKKKQKLWAVLNKELKSWKFRSMWTFTISSDLGIDDILHYSCLSWSLQNTIWELKRNGHLDNHYWVRDGVKYKNRIKGSKIQFKGLFKYFKVVELHKSGYAHFHVLFNQFVKLERVNYYFDKSVRIFLTKYGINPDQSKICNANVSKEYEHKTLCHYVLKYISKTIGELPDSYVFTMYYSKSRNIPAFFHYNYQNSDTGKMVILEYESYWRDNLYLYHKRTFPRNFINKSFMKFLHSKQRPKNFIDLIKNYSNYFKIGFSFDEYLNLGV